MNPENQSITNHYHLHTYPQRSGESDEGGNRCNEFIDNENGFSSISLIELAYSSSSYYAIAKPVTLTIILSSLAVVYINDEQTLQQGEKAMNEAYTVFKTDTLSQSKGEALVLSLGNAFLMVSVICIMTFGIVFLYRLRCMRILIGYMILSSATLLGVLGGTLLEVAIYVYRIPFDKINFFGFLYNFSVVGVIAIFWSEVVPTFVTQGYLIATSVILAWQLTHFDEWTTWALLVMLALYDLCAVLTPCGPLKALVNLMSRDNSPEMPGLLFEAELPLNAKKPGKRNKPQSSSGEETDFRSEHSIDDELSDDLFQDESCSEISQEDFHSEMGLSKNRRVVIPLAIARVYDLPIINESTYAQDGISSSPLLEISDPLTPEALLSMVTVQLPESGGSVEKLGNRTTYLERDRFGVPKRTLWVDKQGKVFAESSRSEDDTNGESSNTIRLGLGDFIFYSVLVSKSAQYSFTSFAACTLTVLAGLGSTLILLSVYHHALPALPISIFLSVIFYVLTRVAIEPWIKAIMQHPIYV